MCLLADVITQCYVVEHVHCCELSDVVYTAFNASQSHSANNIALLHTVLPLLVQTQFKKDPWSETDPSIIMPVRTAIILRGVGLMLQHPVALTNYWTPIAREALRAEELKASKASKASFKSSTSSSSSSSDSGLSPEAQARVAAYEKLNVKFLM
jgi:hypothetical protein